MMNPFQYSEKALETLRNLQIQAANENPYEGVTNTISPQSLSRLPTMALMSQEKQELYEKAISQTFSDIKQVLPTEHEDPSTYMIIGQHLQRLVAVAKQLQYPLPERIVFGTIASLDLNARVIPIDEDNQEVLLVFSRALIPFCLLISDFLAHCLNPNMSEQDRTIQLALDDRNPTIEEIHILHDILGDALRRFEFHYDHEGYLGAVIMDRLTPRPRLSVTSSELLIRDLLLQAIEHFAVGHELGHLILPLSILPSWQEHSAKMKPIEERYLDEHICDVIGQILGLHATYSTFQESGILKYAKKLIYSIGVTSGPLFFTFMYLAEKASYMLKNGTSLPEEVPDFSNTSPNQWKAHPPTFLRIGFLMEKIRNEIDPIFNQSGVEPFAVYNWTDHYCNQAWSELENIFHGYYTTSPNHYANSHYRLP